MTTKQRGASNTNATNISASIVSKNPNDWKSSDVALYESLPQDSLQRKYIDALRNDSPFQSQLTGAMKNSRFESMKLDLSLSKQSQNTNFGWQEHHYESSWTQQTSTAPKVFKITSDTITVFKINADNPGGTAAIAAEEFQHFLDTDWLVREIDKIITKGGSGAWVAFEKLKADYEAKGKLAKDKVLYADGLDYQDTDIKLDANGNLDEKATLQNERVSMGNDPDYIDSWRTQFTDAWKSAHPKTPVPPIPAYHFTSAPDAPAAAATVSSAPAPTVALIGDDVAIALNPENNTRVVIGYTNIDVLNSQLTNSGLPGTPANFLQQGIVEVRNTATSQPTFYVNAHLPSVNNVAIDFLQNSQPALDNRSAVQSTSVTIFDDDGNILGQVSHGNVTLEIAAQTGMGVDQITSQNQIDVHATENISVITGSISLDLGVLKSTPTGLNLINNSVITLGSKPLTSAAIQNLSGTATFNLGSVAPLTFNSAAFDAIAIGSGGAWSNWGIL